MDKLVSVIIPYYNNKDTIIRALESVLNQSYNNLELIIINDGSKDDSYEIVCEYLQKYDGNININHINQENQGPSITRNKGIKLSKGEYIAFLDADDSWNLDKIKIQMDILTRNPHIDLLACNFYIVNTDGKKEKHYFVKDDLVQITFDQMLVKHYYATPCVIVKKQVALNCGMFKENQHYMEDSMLFTKICRDYNGYMTNDFLVNTYKNSFGESGLSGNLNKMQKYEIINFINLYKENSTSNNKLSIFKLIICMVFSTLKFIRRKLIVALRK